MDYETVADLLSAVFPNFYKDQKISICDLAEHLCVSPDTIYAAIRNDRMSARLAKRILRARREDSMHLAVPLPPLGAESFARFVVGGDHGV